MSHNIAKINGKDAMFVVGKREDAWHLLGQRCEKAATWEQAVELSGLNWQVVKQQNYARNPMDKKVVATDSYTIFRDLDGAQLGTVGKDFTIKQNADCFRFVDTLLEANGGAHYDSAGALGNGAKIWCSVRVPRADINVLGKDESQSYLVFATAHDGSLAHTVKLSTVRTVCQNTLHAALSDAGAMFRVKHTRTADARLDNAKHLMTGVVQNAKTLEAKLNQLATRKMTRATMVSVLNQLFPVEGEKSSGRRDNILTQVLELYSSNDNNAVPQIKGTAYNLLNAVTEYVDHFRTARITSGRDGYSVNQARAEGAVSGSGDKLKSSALQIIEQVTTDGKLVHVPFDAPASDPLNDSPLLKQILSDAR